MLSKMSGWDQGQSEAKIVGHEGRRRVAFGQACRGDHLIHELWQECIVQVFEKNRDEEDRLYEIERRIVVDQADGFGSRRKTIVFRPLQYF